MALHNSFTKETGTSLGEFLIQPFSSCGARRKENVPMPWPKVCAHDRRTIILGSEVPKVWRSRLYVSTFPCWDWKHVFELRVGYPFGYPLSFVGWLLFLLQLYSLDSRCLSFFFTLLTEWCLLEPDVSQFLSLCFPDAKENAASVRDSQHDRTCYWSEVLWPWDVRTSGVTWGAAKVSRGMEVGEVVDRNLGYWLRMKIGLARNWCLTVWEGENQEFEDGDAFNIVQVSQHAKGYATHLSTICPFYLHPSKKWGCRVVDKASEIAKPVALNIIGIHPLPPPKATFTPQK